MGNWGWRHLYLTPMEGEAGSDSSSILIQVRLNPKQHCSLFSKHFSFELWLSKGCELHTVKLVWRTNRLVHRWPAPQYSIYVSTTVLDHGTVNNVQLYSTCMYCSAHMCAPQYYIQLLFYSAMKYLSAHNTIRIQCKCIENAGGQGREHRRLSTFALLPCLHFIWQTFSIFFCGFLTYSCYAVACTVPIGIFEPPKLVLKPHIS